MEATRQKRRPNEYRWWTGILKNWMRYDAGSRSENKSKRNDQTRWRSAWMGNRAERMMGECFHLWPHTQVCVAGVVAANWCHSAGVCADVSWPGLRDVQCPVDVQTQPGQTLREDHLTVLLPNKPGSTHNNILGSKNIT